MIFRTRKLISKTICIIPIVNNQTLLNDYNTSGNNDIVIHNNTEHAKSNFNTYAKDKADYKSRGRVIALNVSTSGRDNVFDTIMLLNPLGLSGTGF